MSAYLRQSMRRACAKVTDVDVCTELPRKITFRDGVRFNMALVCYS